MQRMLKCWAGFPPESPAHQLLHDGGLITAQPENPNKNKYLDLS